MSALEPRVQIAPKEKVAVADARIEPQPVAAKRPVQSPDQLGGFRRSDVSRRVILDPPLLVQADQIAAHGHVPVVQRHADAGRFEHAPALKAFRRVIAQDRQVRHRASRRHIGGQRHE